MKLNNMVLIKIDGGFKLESLISEYHIELNEFTAEIIKKMGDKAFSELNETEQSIYNRLEFESFASEGKSEIQIQDKSNSLNNLGIEVTDKCNLTCNHCCLGDKKIEILI